MFRVDLALGGVRSEMDGLRLVLGSLEDHLRIAIELDADGIIEGAKSEWADPDAASSIASDQIAFLRDVSFPRLFRGSYLVTLYAAFEDGLITVGRRAQLGQSDTATLERHGSLATRAVTLFETKLNMDFASEEELRRLELLEETRNVFAHQAGRLGLDDWSSRKRKNSRVYEGTESRAAMFVRWSEKGGPHVDFSEYLVPSHGYCEASLALVTELLRHLVAQVDPGFRWLPGS